MTSSTPNPVTIIRACLGGGVTRTLVPALTPTPAVAPLEGLASHLALRPRAASTGTSRWGVDPFAPRHLRAPGCRSRTLVGPPSPRSPKTAAPAESQDLGSVFVDLHTLLAAR
jgi:hypothetical protein